MDQKTHEPLNDYIAVIRSLSAVAGDIARVEEAKTQAAVNKRHERLDGFIQEEQALLLKLRGLEQHRVKLQDSLGWDALTFRQILKAVPPEEGRALEPAFEELDRQMRRLQQAREAAEKIIHVRLHEIEALTQQAAAYDHAGKEKHAKAAPSRFGSKYV